MECLIFFYIFFFFCDMVAPRLFSILPGCSVSVYVSVYVHEQQCNKTENWKIALHILRGVGGCLQSKIALLLFLGVLFFLSSNDKIG